MITHLIKENGRIAGAAGFSIDEAKVYLLKAKSVVLCSGAGGFKPNGCPICDLTHDGTVMAYHIGAKVTGKEWNDGHPGQTKNAAACYDGWNGMFDRKPGLTGVEVHHDLGVDLNYRAYMTGNPIEIGTLGIEEAIRWKAGRIFLMNSNEMVLSETPARKMVASPKKEEHLREWREHSWAVFLQGCLSTNQKAWFP